MKHYKIYRNGEEIEETLLLKMYDSEFDEIFEKAIDGYLDNFINTDFIYEGDKISIRPADEETATKIELADTYDEAYEVVQEYKARILRELK